MENESDATNRLNKYLALQLGISRREADEMIEQGRVTINGAVATLGARFNETDSIMLGDKQINDSVEYIYLAFYKPAGYVCSRKQQGDSPTIYDLLPEEYHTLKPVGRLDRDSSGLLLLTNDGDFAFQMTHPSFHKTKEYGVRLDKELEPLHQQMISDFGVNLDDGRSQLHLERLKDTDRHFWRVIMHEGRNRQIRRTFAALGYEVIKLHRTTFGNYTLDGLQPGEIHILEAPKKQADSKA